LFTKMASNSELAMTYAALILADDGAECSDANLSKLVKAAGVEVESFWPKVFSKFLANNDVMDLVSKVGSGGGGGGGGGGDAAPAAGGGGAAAAKAPEPEEEEEEEDMGFSLFD